jgi:queuine tRNA-ribosyltransferase
LFTRNGTVKVRNARHRDSLDPPEPGCECYTCTHFSMAYLHHLDRAKEMLGSRLNTIHNLHYYQRLMAELRGAVEQGTLETYRHNFYRILAAPS